MNDVAKRLGVGRLLYHLYFQPKGRLKALMRVGPLTTWRIARGRRAMEAAAERLPPLAESLRLQADAAGRDGAPELPEIHFLSGRRFWYQAAFCAYSMMTAAERPLRPVIYDDGSLDRSACDGLLRLFPWARIESATEIESRVDRELPRDRFPVLRARRDEYVNLRKLIDVHVGRAGWKLVLDADMLFLRRPALLLDWLDAPDRPCHMVDTQESYGYSRRLMAELAGTEIPALLNVGICGLRSDALEWDRIEEWTRRMIEAEGTSYLQEQALVAMLMAGSACAVAPASTYVCKPTRPAADCPESVLHHYVADSKLFYFLHDWRLVADGV